MKPLDDISARTRERRRMRPLQLTRRLEMFVLEGIPEVIPGDDPGTLILAAMERSGDAWQQGDILMVAQKIISKAEGRVRRLSEIIPTQQALGIAEKCGKDARKVQAILDESTAVLRVASQVPDGLVIVRHRQGWICANAGIDESNLGALDGDLLLLPLDADFSAAGIAETVFKTVGIRPGVVVTDTFGRPWRRGLLNVSLGLSEVPAIVDWIGADDAYGRTLRVSQQALADELAAASGLLMPKDAATPVVLVRGLCWTAETNASATRYVRPISEDLFK